MGNIPRHPDSQTWRAQAPVSAKGPHSILDEERYLNVEGNIHLTGIQALVRLPFDNLRLLKKIHPDKKFAYFISGYEGSPLGGLDINLRKIYRLLKEWRILHVPGGNEEAGANMVWGSQLHRLFGPAKVDGVIGAWYGKGPGVRRIADVEDHMQMAGLDKLCAAYFMSGDDHAGKSSTTPHQTDLVHYANHVPTAYPGNVREILEIGKRATLVSLISGLGVNLKVETCVCDGSQEFVLDPEEDGELAERFRKFAARHADYKRYFSPILLKPHLLANEEELFYSKLPMVREISREFGFDVWDNRRLKSDFGVVATGKSYYDLLGALKELGVSADEIEIYKPMITWPPDADSFREFAHDKKEIVVIEEKQAFFETHVKQELFNDARRPSIVGKTGENGETLFRQNANLDADIIARVLGRRLLRHDRFKNRGIDRVLRELEETAESPAPIGVKRPPAYCSGCQHRTALEISGSRDGEEAVESVTAETRDLDGNPVSMEITPRHVMGIGIGCSTMSIIDSLSSNRAVAVGPMESEGLLWMGASAFSYRMHAHQGCGDGTYFHSARLNISFIRDAIEHLKVHYGIEDTSQTLLYVDNSVVAMTGGQRPIGQDDPETAIATIKQEGIECVALVAEFPEEFKHLQKKYGVRVYPKSDTLKVKEEFSQKPGLSVIWYVQKCGIEKSRERRANPELAPKTRVHVNAEVCEDCGDCGLEAKCASVWKTDTEFGPKVRVHQYSCIQDFACAKGECPSYVRVHTRSGSPLIKPDIERIAIGDGELADPERRIDPEKIFEIYSVGIGGWGLMTAYEILARAATSEGLNVVKEDDTGLSQKGGEVRNNIKISWPGKNLNEGFSIEAGGADLYIASDLIGAVNPENLRAASRRKTRAIVNTAKIPTMPMIVGKAVYPDPERLKEIVDSHTGGENNIYVDATDIVESLFKDFKPTNLFLLGIAFQTAANFPIQRARSVEDAIRINDVEAEKNVQAFRYGRLFALDPARVLSAAYPETQTVEGKIASLRNRTGFLDRRRFDRLANRIRFDGDYQGKFAREIFELIKFQNAAYAGRFVDFVAKVHDFEKTNFPLDRFRFTKTVADNLFDLMAYKDEYRVADLLTRPEEIEKIAGQYAKGEIVKIRFLLRPPILELIPWVKDLGFVKARFERDEKWEFPRWTLEVLKRCKILRGTPLDPFAWGNAVRKLERQAIAEYRRRIDGLLPLPNESVYPEACEAASYPSLATGYDKVKMGHTKKAEDFWREKIGEVYQTVREPSRQTSMQLEESNASQENAVGLAEWPGRNRQEAGKRR